MALCKNEFSKKAAQDIFLFTYDRLRKYEGAWHLERQLQMSRGIIYKGVTHITEGPLKGMESRICKIDRYKRLARIMTTLWKDYGSFPAGLEITEKIL